MNWDQIAGNWKQVMGRVKASPRSRPKKKRASGSAYIDRNGVPADIGLSIRAPT